MGHLKDYSIFFLIFIGFAVSPAFADYHYASHEGSNEYPYTSWETAAWLIQDASDAGESYDTVFIAPGEYYETIDMDLADSCMAFIGAGWDSTIIWTDLNQSMIRRARKTSFIDIGFKHYGEYAAIILGWSIFGDPKDLYVNRCKFWGSDNTAILDDVGAINIIENSVFNSLSAYNGTFGTQLTIFRNNMCTIGDGVGHTVFWLGIKLIAENNIFWVPGRTEEGAMHQAGHIDTLIIRNNLFKFTYRATDMNLVKRGSEFSYNVLDSVYASVIPALTLRTHESANDSSYYVDVIGNCFRHSNTAIRIQDIDFVGDRTFVSVDYNNFWDNNIDIDSDREVLFDSVGNIFADPMFVGGDDYHLQAFSPLIDAGDPEIFDPDGSRSDIGIYGGPLGENYDYIDLPPSVPDNLSALVVNDTIFIDWRYNTEADFDRYQLHRDTISGFEPSIFNMIAEPESSFYMDIDFEFGYDFYYRISAVDNQDNMSDYSEELAVILTDIDPSGLDYPLRTSISGCYPNPFNSRVTINYSVANMGPMPVDLRIEIYDLLGRIVRNIEIKDRYSGEYSIVWNGKDDLGNEVSSGLYFVKIIHWEDVIETQPKKIMLLR